MNKPKQVKWQLKRQIIENSQALSRWDQAYQLLLQIALAGVPPPAHQSQSSGLPGPTATDKDKDKDKEEVTKDKNEDCRLCPGLKPPAGPNPNHRRAVGADQDSFPISQLALQ
jgi:hypothetical protein